MLAGDAQSFADLQGKGVLRNYYGVQGKHYFIDYYRVQVNMLLVLGSARSNPILVISIQSPTLYSSEPAEPHSSVRISLLSLPIFRSSSLKYAGTLGS